MPNYYTEILSDPEARNQLPYRGNMYPHKLSVRRFLGYSPKIYQPASWVAYVRHGKTSRIRKCTFAQADDHQKANGKTVMSFEQAVEFAVRWCSESAQSALVHPKTFGYRQLDLKVCPCGPTYTVNHALDEYLKWRQKHQGYQSYLSTLSRINRFIVPTVGTIPVEDLTPETIYDMMHTVVVTPYRGELRNIDPNVQFHDMDSETLRRRRLCANYVLCDLRAALEMAWENGKAQDNCMWRRVRFFKRVQKPRADMLTHAQCIEVLKRCDKPLEDLVLGALYTGTRITELISIQAEDICENRMAVYIRPAKNHLPRYVALPEEGYNFFKLIAQRKGKSELIFLNAKGKRWTRYAYLRPFKKAIQLAGLPRTIVFHTLRHTYASLLIQNNASPLAVARQLGHQGLRTVMRTYAHCADDFVDKEIREKFVPILGDDQMERNDGISKDVSRTCLEFKIVHEASG